MLRVRAREPPRGEGRPDRGGDRDVLGVRAVLSYLQLQFQLDYKRRLHVHVQYYMNDDTVLHIQRQRTRYMDMYCNSSYPLIKTLITPRGLTRAALCWCR